MKVADTYPILVIFDVFKGQTTEAILQILEVNHIYFVSIPLNYVHWHITANACKC